MPRAILQISAQLLVELCKGLNVPRRFTVTENALPDDARAVGGEYSYGLDGFRLVVESAEFPDVVEGDYLPPLPAVRFEHIRLDGPPALLPEEEQPS